MSKLTAVQVKNAKPGRHADGKGLYLYVKPKIAPDGSTAAGAKSWVLRIVVNRRRRDFGLGPVDLVSLQEAREKALEGRKLARAGLDPSVEWKRPVLVIPTFAEAARGYHERVKAGWKNGKHEDEWLGSLERHAFPSIGKRLVDDIDAAAIQSVLVPMWLTLPETARRTRQRVLAVLDYAHGQGWRKSEAPRNAVNSLMKRIKQPKKGAGLAAMPYAELPAIMAELREGDTVGRMATRFCILTASRPGNVRKAKWDQFDLEAQVWNIPAAEMKGGEAHSVPLTPECVAILEAVRPLSGARKDGVVFPGSSGAMSDATMAKAFRLAGGGAYTVHGSARSGFRDWAAEKTSFPPAWAEAALAHALTNKVEAAYLRTKYLEQRRDLMGRWADFLAGKSNVVAIAGQKAAASA